MKALYIKDGELNDGKALHIGDTWIFNPTPEIFYENGWSDYEETIDDVRDEMIYNITVDSESHLFVFQYKDRTYCNFELNDYMELKNLISDLELLGEQTVFIKQLEDELSIEDAKKMLAVINLYNMKCNKVTQEHINKINAMTDKEDIRNYQYNDAYPPIPVIKCSD